MKHSNNFIKNSTILHKGKYYYNLVDYINNKTKVKIICPIHGIFKQIPNNHLNGSGCKKCNMIPHNKDNKKSFIDKSIKKHGNLYDYSKVKYTLSQNKVEIICHKHGIFNQKPYSHIKGDGCPLCSINKKDNKKSFIDKSIKKHGNLYDYSKVKYTLSQNKVEIICHKHGIFEQNPNSHILGKGCPLCSNNIKLTNEDFIKSSVNKHGNKYDYSLVNYKNSNSKVEIICHKHGSFFQKAYNHKNGEGCPLCKTSSGEREIEKNLKLFEISYEREKTFEGCKNKQKLRFDFYLNKYNICIEYNGRQHYEPIEFFGGKDSLIKQRKNDSIKLKYCKTNNIKLIIIPHTQYSEIFKYIEKLEKLND